MTDLNGSRATALGRVLGGDPASRSEALASRLVSTAGVASAAAAGAGVAAMFSGGTGALPTIEAVYRKSGFANIPDSLVAVGAAVGEYDTDGHDYYRETLPPPQSIITAVAKGGRLDMRGDGALGVWYGDREWASEAPDREATTPARPLTREEHRYLDANAAAQGWRPLDRYAAGREAEAKPEAAPLRIDPARKAEGSRTAAALDDNALAGSREATARALAASGGDKRVALELRLGLETVEKEMRGRGMDVAGAGGSAPVRGPAPGRERGGLG